MRRFLRSILKLLYILLIFINLFTTFSEALAHWRINQKQHSLVVLNDDELKQVAALTDIVSIRSLLQPILVERQVGTEEHKKVANYLKTKVEEFGFTTEWDSSPMMTPYGEKTFNNIIATLNPRVHRRLVLACHYDSKILPGQVFIGATDSALPCALLLDIAKTLQKRISFRDNQHITLQLIFFDGEEAFRMWSAHDSIYGARALAKTWERKWYPTTDGSGFVLGRELDRIDVLVLLDLLGAKKPRIQYSFGHMSEKLFGNLPRIETDLSRLGVINKLPRIFFSGVSYSTAEDDHIPFLQRGVPVMHLIPMPFPDVWHSPKDDVNVLDNPTIENLASIIRVFVARYLGIHPFEA
uniref:Glutaminyl-peptide cyclotransferase n=1 Tax=Meloidogyne incognita TaxID=6306 RepID=A0A914LJA7_MELIC